MTHDDIEIEDGMDSCAHCGGSFFAEDMDGEHCRGCAEEIFGDDL